MTKDTDAGAVRPLNAVFSAPCHVAILRALFESREPASGRRIARDAGVNHQACAEGLRRLERLGLVQREVLGRTHAFSLNGGHPVVDALLNPLYREERGLAAQDPSAEPDQESVEPAVAAV